jgi:CRISPR-associated protein Csm4
MKTIRLKLKPLGSYLTDWSSDTITGALLWVYSRRFGPEALGQLISAFLQNKPPFVLSSGFPGDLLPRPLLPQPARPLTNLKQIEEGKKLKKSQWVTLDTFNSLRQGQQAYPEEIPKPQFEELVTHNQVSRLTGTTGEDGGLYTVEEKFLNIKHYRYISVYANVQPDWEGLLGELFSDLGRTGIGARSSTGKGAFVVEETADFHGFSDLPETNSCIILGNITPRATEPARGYFKITIKRGKLGEEYAKLPNPFKKPLVMLVPGSVLYSSASVPGWLGRFVEDIAPAAPQVVHCGMAMVTPARLL